MRKDECAVIIPNILCSVPVPSVTGSSIRQYQLPAETVELIKTKYNDYMLRQRSEVV